MRKRILCRLMCTALILIIASCFGGCNSGNKKSSPGQSTVDRSSLQNEKSNSKNRLEAMFQEYILAWQNSDYKAMYAKLGSSSKENISEDAFVKRYTGIYKGIEASNLTVQAEYPESVEPDEFGRVGVRYTASMETAAGRIDFSHTAMLKEEDSNREKQWKLLWNAAMIFPDMEDSDKVKIIRKSGRRGEIKDRSGQPLAVNGFAAEIGIVPQNLGDPAEESKSKISEILNMPVESINKKLSASYVKPNMFIPLKVISKDQDEALSRLREIPGIMIRDKSVRVYPLKEKTAHLTGYVQQLSGEELKKLENEGYTPNDILGKYGLEKIYEKEFRSADGAEIYIEDKYGTKKKVLAVLEPKVGMDLKLTIDSKIQNALYEELKQDSGTGIAINPKTGEVLALVSTPAYDPNRFVLGMTSDEWNAISKNPQKPLFNRFQGSFIPGSSFKPITTAIGLKLNKLDPEASADITGLKWQKDSSWGNYYVTRVRDYKKPSNLLNAMIYSDNIYFAQAALKIGRQDFVSEVKNFGIGEEIPFEYPMVRSQFDADGKIKNDIQLADSGYGQGEVLMNPLHLAAIYGSFVNGGTLLKPKLLLEEEQSPDVWKSDVFPAETANLVLKCLTQVIENAGGTGHEAFIPGLFLAGKTGTAEIKQKQGDTNGTELGWFAAVNTGKPDLLVLMMIEDVKGRGGSHYIVPKVKRVMEKFLKQSTSP